MQFALLLALQQLLVRHAGGVRIVRRQRGTKARTDDDFPGRRVSLAHQATEVRHVNVGEGHCSDHKVLAGRPGVSLEACFRKVAADVECKNKGTVTFGKGKRAGLCRCDKPAICPRIRGLKLGADGYDRFQETKAVHVKVGDGYCGQHKSLARNATSLEDCIRRAAADGGCSNKLSISFAKAQGSMAGACLCDKEESCSQIHVHQGSDGYDRFESLYSKVGDGYCRDYKWLDKGVSMSVEECFLHVAADPSCMNAQSISYGRGSRAGRCMCDLRASCSPLWGGNLTEHGFDRFQLNVVPPSTYYSDVGEGFCQFSKELGKGMSVESCFRSVAADAECAIKEIISFGKGDIAGRCLCDLRTACRHARLWGGNLKEHGYGRFQLMVPLPTCAEGGVHSRCGPMINAICPSGWCCGEDGQCRDDPSCDAGLTEWSDNAGHACSEDDAA